MHSRPSTVEILDEPFEFGKKEHVAFNGRNCVGFLESALATCGETKESYMYALSAGERAIFGE